MRNLFVKISIAAACAGTIIMMSQCNSDKPADRSATSAEGNKMVPEKSSAKGDSIERGKYLVAFGGCDDCHSPKTFTDKGPQPDESRRLSGHPAGDPLPKFNAKDIRPGNWYLAAPDLTAWVGPWGISYTANLTPDSATGLGAWAPELFIKTMRSGKHMGEGRDILPPMPWYTLAGLTDEDLNAIFAYLRTLKPIVNKVPVPVSPMDLSKK